MNPRLGIKHKAQGWTPLSKVKEKQWAQKGLSLSGGGGGDRYWEVIQIKML